MNVGVDDLEPLPDDEDLVPSSDVRRENGNVTAMTLWRWSRDPRINFPPPDVVINNRNYWKRRTLRRQRRRMEETKRQASFQEKSPQPVSS
jgi:hypothetical protein